MKILIVYNPIAGSGAGKKAAEELKEYFNKEKMFFYEINAESKNELQEKVLKKANNFDLIFVCGGDGTFRDVVEILDICNWPAPIAFIPAGSGNDFSKSLGIEGDVKYLAEHYLSSQEVNVYGAKCNDFSLINVFGVGIDTSILKKSVSLKKYFGGFSYVISTIISIFAYKPKKYVMHLDRKKIEGKFYIVAVCNGSYFGGGMKIGPKASVDDEKFHVVMLGDVSKIKLLKAFIKIFKGQHIDLPYVKSYKARNVRIEFEKDKEDINLDGDVFYENFVDLKKAGSPNIRMKMPPGYSNIIVTK